MIRVFEAFSGIGTQNMALKKLNIPYEIVATSEIDIDAITAYSFIHHFEDLNKDICYPTKKKIIEFLNNKNIGNLNIDELNSLSLDRLQNLYKFCVLNKNIGDISKVDLNLVPDHDLFTYSFPCQDLSTFGTRLGCAENSGTRSSLLWQCKKIIETKKPKYLILENVKNLIGKTHKKNFNQWLKFLSDQGYINYYDILDSSDFGIPQRRKRVFVVSILNENLKYFEFPKSLPLLPINNFIDLSLDLAKYTKHLDKVNLSAASNKFKFLDDRDWNFNGVVISDICPTQRAGRSGIKICKLDNNTLLYRNITPFESWKLMGISDEFINKIKFANLSSGTLFKLAGNAIVVNVLEEILKNIFKRRTF